MGMTSTPDQNFGQSEIGIAPGYPQQGLGNPSIGMPYGPGYTDPNQPKDLGQPQIGMPAGPGYMQPSSGGKGGMPSMPDQGPQPVFNLPNPVTMPGPGDISIGLPYGPGYTQPGQPMQGLGQPQIGMPAGPGYMQPTPLPSPTVKAQPMPLPSPYPMPTMAPVPQSMQQIAEQVGLRNNFVPSRNRLAPRIVTTAMQQQQQPLFDRARENVPTLGVPAAQRAPLPMSQSTRAAQPKPRVQVAPRIASTGSLRRR